MNTPKQFIIVYDDEASICVPMGWDNRCTGAVESRSADQPVAVFASRKDARKSISISAAFARLQKAQGVPYNADFTDLLKFIKIVPLAPAAAP